MKTRTLPNNKLILLGAFVAAIVFPYAAGAVTSTTSTDQNVSFTISKAIEVVQQSTPVSLGSTAPLVGSSSFTRELTGSGNVTAGQRSNATGDITVQRTGAASQDVKGVLSIQDNASAFQPAVANSTAVKIANLERNTDNNLQAAVSASFKLPISWADLGSSTATTIPIKTTVANGA